MRILPWFFILLSFHATGENRPPWVDHARELIGETAGVREKAMLALAEKFVTFDELTPELKGEFRHYALDVAVALKLPGTVDKLLDNLDSDADGALALAVNALVDNENHKRIGEKYIDFLEARPLTARPTPVIMAMLDYFTHLRRPLPAALYESLLLHLRIEVQQSAVLHAGVIGHPAERDLIERLLPRLFPQARTQYMLTEYDLKETDRALKICANDKDPIVQSACEGLTEKPKPLKKKKTGKKKPKGKKPK